MGKGEKVSIHVLTSFNMKTYFKVVWCMDEFKIDNIYLNRVDKP